LLTKITLFSSTYSSWQLAAFASLSLSGLDADISLLTLLANRVKAGGEKTELTTSVNKTRSTTSSSSSKQAAHHRRILGADD